MKAIKRTFILMLCIAAVMCFSTAIIIGHKAFAAETVAAESDYQVYGGSVKIADARGAGVKFHVVMTENYFRTYGTIGEDGKGTLNGGVQTGTLLLPHRLTNGQNLTVGGTGYGAAVSDSDTSEIWRKVKLNGTDYMQSVVYLYNIPDTDYGTEISVRGYVLSGGEYTYTAQKDVISMSYVAKAALKSGDIALSEADKTNIQETYLNKTVRYHVNGVVTEETVDYLDTVANLPTVSDGSFIGWANKNGEFVTNVSSTRIKNHIDLYAVGRQQIVLSGSSCQISLGNYEYDSVKSITYGSYDLGTNPAALTVSDALKADAQNHGEKELTVTLVKNSQEFTVNLPVLLVTGTIATPADFRAIQPTPEKKGVYGYYVMTSDFEDTTLNNGNRKQTPYAGDWDATTGFFGTIDGRGHTITTAGNGITGIFGILRKATIKNLTIKDKWRSTSQGCALLAVACYGCTIENVTFTLVAGGTQTAVGNGYGWISCAEFSNNTVKNVTVNDDKGYSSLFGHKFFGNTFENLVVKGTYAEMGHTATNEAVSYEELTMIAPETATMPERQDFVLDGEWDLLDLGAYNGLEILSVVTEHGESLNGISPVAARNILTDKTKHGEQNFTVTVLKEDGNKAIITVPVTVITKEITTMSDFLAAVKVDSETESKYGYYVLGKDISHTESGFIWFSGKGNYESGAAFRGVVDGKNHTVTTRSGNTAYGLFATLNGATIKNLTIVDEKAANSGYAPAIARNAYGTTFENLTVKILEGPAANGSIDNTQFIGREMKNCVWRNVKITSAVDIVNVFATQTGNTFENVNINANVTGGFSITDANFPTGVSVGEEATLVNTYDFALSGENKGITLGEGFEDVTVTKIECDGIDVTTDVSSLSAKVGTNVTLTVFAARGAKNIKLTVPAFVVTEKISTMKQLESAVRYYGTDKTGYFVLANDISTYESGFAWEKSAYTVQWNATNGFIGTLDGRGHTITVLSSSNDFAGGLFGMMNGTLKNVTIDAKNAVSYSKSIIARICSGVVENVTVNIFDGGNSSYPYENKGDAALVESALYKGSWKNVTVNSDTKVNFLFPITANNKATFENCKLIAPDYNKINSDAETVSSWTFICNEATLTGTYDYVLNGEGKGITLGEGYENATIIKIECNGQDITDATTVPDNLLGEKTLKITVEKDSSTIKLTVPAFVVTEKISTMKQLESAVRYYGTDKTGYFVLANDISTYESGFAWEKSAYTVQWNATNGFIGTLDGRGHTITVLSSSNDFAGGLFGMMNGTLKNVTIDAKNAVSYSKSIIARICSGVVENVTVNIFDGGNSSYPYENSTVGALVESALYKGSWKNVTVNSDTKVNFLFPITNNNKATFENCNLIAPAYNKINSDAETVSGWTFTSNMGTTELKTSSARVINLNINNGEVNTADTYTLDIEGLTEMNFVSASYNGKKLATNGLTFKVSEFGKTYGESELEIEYFFRGEKRTHVVPIVLATGVLTTAEDLSSF